MRLIGDRRDAGIGPACHRCGSGRSVAFRRGAGARIALHGGGRGGRALSPSARIPRGRSPSCVRAAPSVMPARARCPEARSLGVVARSDPTRRALVGAAAVAGDRGRFTVFTTRRLVPD